MPTILLTNDDGVSAPGLATLATCLGPLGDVVVVAPAEESSAVSHALTVRRPLTLSNVSNGWSAVDGTPTDCVNVAVSELLEAPPDLVVSGINNGLNIGDDVTYSGTVAGALEGILLGIPAIAVSQQRTLPMHYDRAGIVAAQLAAAVLDEGLPPRTLLNVNVPRGTPHGVRVTVQAGRTQEFALESAPAPSERTRVWIGAASFDWDAQPDSDYRAIQDRWVSVTPLRPDWTHRAAIPAVEALAAKVLAEVE